VFDSRILAIISNKTGTTMVAKIMLRKYLRYFLFNQYYLSNFVCILAGDAPRIAFKKS